MNPTRDPESILAAWLDEGPTHLPDATRRAILTALPTTKQARRGLFAPRRFSRMTTYTRLAAAALVAAIAVGGAIYFLGSSSGTGGPGATPTPSPAPSPTAAPPSPTAVAVRPTMPLDTPTWTQFTASRYGYTVAWPNTAVWINSPATEDWAGQTAYDMWASTANAPWVDKFYDRATQLTVTAVATTMPAGSTEEAFIDLYLKPGTGTAPVVCTEPAKDMPHIVIDGRPARETTKCSDQAAFVAVGQRMYVFSISNQNEVPFLNAYLSTIKLPAVAPKAT